MVVMNPHFYKRIFNAFILDTGYTYDPSNIPREYPYLLKSVEQAEDHLQVGFTIIRFVLYKNGLFMFLVEKKFCF